MVKTFSVLDFSSTDYHRTVTSSPLFSSASIDEVSAHVPFEDQKIYMSTIRNVNCVNKFCLRFANLVRGRQVQMS